MVKAARCWIVLALVMTSCAGRPLRLASPGIASTTRAPLRPARIELAPIAAVTADAAPGPVRLGPVRLASAPPAETTERRGDVPSGPLPSYVGRVPTDGACRTLFGTGPRYDEGARCTGGQGAEVFTIPAFHRTPADPVPNP